MHQMQINMNAFQDFITNIDLINWLFDEWNPEKHESRILSGLFVNDPHIIMMYVPMDKVK